MGIFSLGSYSSFFKVFIVLIPISLILKVLRNLYLDKTINAYMALPDSRKERIIRVYRSAISTWKIFLWVMPFSLLLILALFKLLFMYPELNSIIPGGDTRQVVIWMLIGFIYGYIAIAEDSYHKKKILKAIESTG